MSRSSQSPRAVEPKRPTLRLRPSPTLPPVGPPPRRLSELPVEERSHALAPSHVPPPLPPAAPHRTLPPMPLVPVIAPAFAHDSDPDAWLDETEIRQSDLDSSVPGVTEVKSALAFNRRHRIPASELFEASTNRLDRRALLREAGLMPVGEDNPTAPTLVAPTRPSTAFAEQTLTQQRTPALTSGSAHARATMQVSPNDLERVRRLSQTLERDSVPVLELVDSVELSGDDLIDAGHDEEEPETLAEPQVYSPSSPASSLPSPRRPEVSDPGLQGFHGNDDWGLVSGRSEPVRAIEDQGRPLVGLSGVTGETPWLGDVRDVHPVKFVDEDEPLPPVDVSFADDHSLLPDLRPESVEVRALHPAAPMTTMRSVGPVAMAPAMVSSGFAPIHPNTALRTSPGPFAPQAASPQFAAYGSVPTPSGFAAPQYAPPAPAMASRVAPIYGQAPVHDSGHVSITSDVAGHDKSSWIAPLLFVAVLIGAVFGGYFVLGPRAAQPSVAAPAPPAPPVAVVAPVVTQVAPVEQAAPPVMSAPPPVAPPAVAPSAAAPAVAPTHAPTAQKPSAAPAKTAPKSAPKKAPAPKSMAKPAAEDDGPKAMPGPVASPASEPAMPSVQGLGDLLNGAL